jgi:DNA-binding NarL/FixJ family response regulator
MNSELEKGFRWTPGAIAFWLWAAGELQEAPSGIAEPYRLVIERNTTAAADIWEALGCPYDRAVALAHGDDDSQVEAVALFDDLGADAVSRKLRKSLRDRGIAVPRGKTRTTINHDAGLTGRQAEVLDLLAEGMTNLEVADRLFLSPRTVEHHVSSILSKLDSHTREQAVAQARERGLLGAKTA